MANIGFLYMSVTPKYEKILRKQRTVEHRNIRFGVDNTLITNGASAFAVTQMFDWVKKASERTDVSIVSDFQILSKEVRSIPTTW